MEIEGRLRSQQKLLGKIVGVMFPPLFGCRTPAELCRVRGWDKQLALTAAGGFAQTLLAQAAAAPGPGGVGATVAPCGDARVRPRRAAGSGPGRWMTRCSTSMVSSWVWSGAGGAGSNIRVLSGIDGLLLVVVIGDGKLVVPVDFAIRRPDPVGAWGPVPGQTALGADHAR